MAWRATCFFLFRVFGVQTTGLSSHLPGDDLALAVEGCAKVTASSGLMALRQAQASSGWVEM